MTQEIYQELLKYGKHLTNAYKGNYYRGITTTELIELDKIYQQLFNQKSKLTNSCSHCVLSELKRLGKALYDYVPETEVETPIKKTRTNKNKKK